MISFTSVFVQETLICAVHTPLTPDYQSVSSFVTVRHTSVIIAMSWLLLCLLISTTLVGLLEHSSFHMMQYAAKNLRVVFTS